MMLAEKRAGYWPIAGRTIHDECGPHQIAAALRAYGIERGIDELYAFGILRSLDWMLPWDPVVILARFNIRSRLFFWLKSSFLFKVKRSIESGNAVLLIILSICGRGRLHWISAWGYDPATDEFLCYDSQCKTVEGNEGNVRYRASELLDHLPWRGTFAVEVG